MDDNKEFDESTIDSIWGVLLIVGGWYFQNMEDTWLVGLDYQSFPLATSQNMQSFNHILTCFAL